MIEGPGLPHCRVARLRMGVIYAACALMISPMLSPGAGSQSPPASTANSATSPVQQSPAGAVPAPRTDQAALELRRAVDQAINERLKDSKVVDVETSQAIATRLSNWAKLFAFFIGIPLAVLVTILGFLGFRTYNDFTTRVNAAREDVLKRLADSRSDAEVIARDFQALRDKFAETALLASQLQELSKKVERIEDVVRFKASPTLTPALKEGLEKSLKEYSSYLKSVGLSLKLRPPTVVIDDKILNAYYEPAPKNRIVIHSELAAYPDAPLREFTHHVLSSLKPEWGAGLDPAGLESGLADYLPASFLDRSDFGRDIWPVFQRHTPGPPITSRDLDNQRSFSEIKLKKPSPHSYGTIWGGASWELRDAMGRETIDKLLLAAWTECDLEASSRDISVFPRELLHQDAVLEAGRHAADIRDVFERRGLTL